VTITLCNGKGGSGKTTLTVLLASALAEAGHRVGVLDTDPQKTATRWIQEIGGVALFESGQSYSALLIDTPPRLECDEFTEAVSRSDVTVVVSSPSPADLFTSRDTVAVLDKLGARAHLLFNQGSGWHNSLPRSGGDGRAHRAADAQEPVATEAGLSTRGITGLAIARTGRPAPRFSRLHLKLQL
jgi:MinD superfamily P-loop ATPase